MDDIMDAIIVSSGFSTRLEKETLKDTLPKCLVSVGGRAVLLWQLDSLSFFADKFYVVVRNKHVDLVKKFLKAQESNYSLRVEVIGVDDDHGNNIGAINQVPIEGSAIVLWSDVIPNLADDCFNNSDIPMALVTKDSRKGRYAISNSCVEKVFPDEDDYDSYVVGCYYLPKYLREDLRGHTGELADYLVGFCPEVLPMPGNLLADVGTPELLSESSSVMDVVSRDGTKITYYGNKVAKEFKDYTEARKNYEVYLLTGTFSEAEMILKDNVLYMPYLSLYIGGVDEPIRMLDRHYDYYGISSTVSSSDILHETLHKFTERAQKLYMVETTEVLSALYYLNRITAELLEYYEGRNVEVAQFNADFHRFNIGYKEGVVTTFDYRIPAFGHVGTYVVKEYCLAKFIYGELVLGELSDNQSWDYNPKAYPSKTNTLLTHLKSRVSKLWLCVHLLTGFCKYTDNPMKQKLSFELGLSHVRLIFNQL